MYVMNLATVAAFMAAGLSLVNIVIGARLTRRGGREQWRRDQERPVVARSLTLSVNARRAWWEVSMELQGVLRGEKLRYPKELGEGRESLADLRFEIAQLDLLSSRGVRGRPAF